MLSDENMNINEKAKLVTNDTFIFLSDERNSEMNNFESSMKPTKTLSSFLLESQFYENLQIVRLV